MALQILNVLYTVFLLFGSASRSQATYFVALAVFGAGGVVGTYAAFRTDDWVFYNYAVGIMNLLLVTGLLLGAGSFFMRVQTQQFITGVFVGVRDSGSYIKLLLTIVMSGVAWLLFRFKSANLLNYARLEITFAVASCYATLLKAQGQSLLSVITILGGAIYLLVRGLDNRNKAIFDKERASLAAKAIRNEKGARRRLHLQCDSEQFLGAEVLSQKTHFIQVLSSCKRFLYPTDAGRFR